MQQNFDSTRKSLARYMKQRGQLPIGNWPHFKPTKIHTATTSLDIL
jgi:hypothetical protein